jgi:hypothetical protein
MEDTHLCSHWQLTMKPGYSVSAEDIKSPVLVFEENHGLRESWQGKQYVWSVRDQQTEWSHMFPLPDN